MTNKDSSFKIISRKYCGNDLREDFFVEKCRNPQQVSQPRHIFRAVAEAAALINEEYNIFTQVVGGRALIRSELVGKDDAYEYIRGINDSLDNSVFDCSNSEYEK
jgi:hypothetical protein